jgi:hydroxyacylglutathione hydrolase
LRPAFASWLGWLVTAGQPIVFVLDEDQERSEVVRQSLDVGHERLVGELAGGIDAWAASGRPLATIELVAPTTLNRRIIDVRQANEYASGHLPGAVNVELGSITTSELPVGTLMIMCGHGERAMTAASLITATRHHDLVVLDGGPDTWSTAAQIPLEIGR